MTDLKVWVDGKERVIRGVSEETTCESVVLVLAKAVEKSGKVALLEKWRDHERILPRNENPLKCLEAWGTHKKEVRLVLQDDDMPKKTIDLTKDSINLRIDNKYDLIKRSVDCEFLENLTALQKRKLNSLSRALEMVDLQLSCLDDSDEKFLYLTEDEIIEDFSLKLSQTVKLQAKELDEFLPLQTELNELQQFYEKMTSKFEFYSDKISQFESEIATTYDIVEKLLKRIENNKNDGVEKSLDLSSDVQNEMRVLQLELQEQKRVSLKQDKELEAIERSVSELTKVLHHKTNKIDLLKSEITSDEVFYDLDEDFRPQSPEEEPYFYRKSLSSDSDDKELATSIENKFISKATPKIKSESNSRQVESDKDIESPKKSSSGSPEEFFKNWSSSTRLASPPLNYYLLRNGVKSRMENTWSSFSSKSKSVLQTLSKQENGRNDSESASNEKVELPFSGSRDKNSFVREIKGITSFENGKDLSQSGIQNQCSLQDLKSADATFMDSALLITQESSSSNPSIKNGETVISHHPIESSTTENELHEKVKLNSIDETFLVSVEKNETNKVYNTLLSKRLTKPNALQSSHSSLELPKKYVQQSTLTNQGKEISTLNTVSQEIKKTGSTPPATLPKPQRKSSSGCQTSSRTGALSSLFKQTQNKVYLLPPAVQYKRSHHHKERPLNRDDLCEEGVFV